MFVSQSKTVELTVRLSGMARVWWELPMELPAHLHRRCMLVFGLQTWHIRRRLVTTSKCPRIEQQREWQAEKQKKGLPR